MSKKFFKKKPKTELKRELENMLASESFPFHQTDLKQLKNKISSIENKTVTFGNAIMDLKKRLWKAS